MEGMAHNMGNGSNSRNISSRRINWGIYKRKSIVMEAKKLFKVKVKNKVFKVEAYSKYHAIDKVYTAFCIEVGNRKEYKIIK